MNDKLQFFYRSADKFPGKGTGENINNPHKYNKLSKIKNWRKVFSSLWDEQSFQYNNFTYRSFEHAFQSEKFRITGYLETANRFTLESNDKIGKDSGLNARKCRKLIILVPNELELWEKNRQRIKTELYKAKYSSGFPKEVLLATNDAELYSSVPRGKRIRCIRLENIRNEINKN